MRHDLTHTHTHIKMMSTALMRTLLAVLLIHAAATDAFAIPNDDDTETSDLLAIANVVEEARRNLTKFIDDVLTDAAIFRQDGFILRQDLLDEVASNVTALLHGQ